MIRIAMAAVAAAVLASACGAGDKATIIASCTKDGDNQKTCECIGAGFEKELDKDAFHALALNAQGKSEEADKLMNSLSTEKKLAVGAAAVSVTLKCATSAAS